MSGKFFKLKRLILAIWGLGISKMAKGMTPQKLSRLGWFSIAIMIAVLNVLIISLSLFDRLGFGIAEWNFVPSIVNGMVSASSILIAVALFSLNYFNAAAIVDSSLKVKYHSMALHYMLVLFGMLIGQVFFGYLMVTVNVLPLALCFFMTGFFLQCGVILDLWINGQKYL